MKMSIVTSLLIVAGTVGCGAPGAEPDAPTSTVQSAVTRGGASRPFHHTFLGRFRPSNAQWTLDLTVPGSGGTLTTVFGYGNPNDTPLVGDWNGDGVETQGVWRASQWLLSNTLGNPAADVSFIYGNPTDLPVVGDWDGDGKATPGVYRNGTFFLRNSNTAGNADLSFAFGAPGNIPIAGDWNGDGIDTVGVYDPANGTFKLTNNPGGSSVADVVVSFGNSNMRPFVGDFDRDGKVTFGVASGSDRYLLNYLTQTVPDIYLSAAGATTADIPITGNWTPDNLPRPPTAPAALASFFPIGIWDAFAAEFPKWRGRGINTVVGVQPAGFPPLNPTGDTVDNWTNAANCVGVTNCTPLKMIRDARPDPGADQNEANLLAWLPGDPSRNPPFPGDEPDGLGQGTVNTAIDRYQQLKAVNSRPILEDLTGRVVYDPTPDVCGGPGDYPNAAMSCEQGYMLGADWIMHDIYPINAASQSWGLSPVPFNDIRTVARTMDKISRWTNKSQLAVLEASAKIYSTTSLGPTPAQMRAEIWLAIIHGARGIVYFTYTLECPGLTPVANCSDGVPSNVVTEIKTQNARITSLTTVLQSPINPSTIGFSMGKTSVDWPIEATWRQFGGKSYFIVLNTSPNTLTSVPMTVSGISPGAQVLSVMGENYLVGLLGGQKFIDSFQPYQLHIYSTN